MKNVMKREIYKFQQSAPILLSTIISAMILCSCQPNKSKISGRFIGGDSPQVYLEEVGSALAQTIIDSATLDKDGNFALELLNNEVSPKLYNIIYDYERIPLFVAQGDNISLNSVGNIARNYRVDGSKESELLREFYQAYLSGMTSLDKIATKYGNERTSDEERTALTKEYSDEYSRIKREQLKFIIEHKSNLAAVYALYQRLPNDSYLFNGKSDAIYYRTVAEAIEQSYPESSFLKNLEADIKNFDTINALTDNMTQRGYPDLELIDMYGNKIKLSSLEGNVILLDFWSAEIGNGNVANAELKELYTKYHDQGFEVYQVGIDSSKTHWINTVQEQKLPWISVSDFQGSKSSTLGTYNVTRIPSNFLISKAGEIIIRDIYGDELISHIESELAK